MHRSGYPASVGTAANLLVTTGEHAYQFSAIHELTIGRDANCSIVVDHPTVSRLHARARVVDAKWVIEDAGSTGGLWHEGERVACFVIDRPLTIHLAGPNGPSIQLVLAAAVDAAGTRSEAKDQAEETLQTAEAARIVIGRDPSCDIVVDDLLVSRQHARFPERAGPVLDRGPR